VFLKIAGCPAEQNAAAGSVSGWGVGCSGWKPGAAAGNSVPGGGAAGGGNSRRGTLPWGAGDFPLPPYPTSARERGFQGTVRVSIQVKDGVIQDVTVVSSSGYVVLDMQTIRWIKARWTFPKQITREYKTVPVTFRLNE